MEKSTPTLMSAVALRQITSLFAMPIHQMGDAIVLSDFEEAERHQREFPEDATGFEAFVNHYHLDDFTSGLSLEPKTKRREQRRLGQALITVWAERIATFLGERSALFYLGGKDDVVMRFHVEREGMPWAPLDPTFLRKEKMAVFRANRFGVRRII